MTVLSGSVPAGGHYLVQEAAGAGGTTPLPTPDATGSIAMSATAGKVALVTASTALTCGGDCDTAAGVRDFVGYGTANDFETAPHAGPVQHHCGPARRRCGHGQQRRRLRRLLPASPQLRRRRAADPGVPGLTIADIQGAAHRSPREGVRVAEVPGVVTAKSGNGFWYQDAAPDTDPRDQRGSVRLHLRRRPTWRSATR